MVVILMITIVIRIITIVIIMTARFIIHVIKPVISPDCSSQNGDVSDNEFVVDNNRKNRLCFNCHKSGHQSQDCRQPQRSSNDSFNSNASNNSFLSNRSNQSHQSNNSIRLDVLIIETMRIVSVITAVVLVICQKIVSVTLSVQTLNGQLMVILSDVRMAIIIVTTIGKIIIKMVVSTVIIVKIPTDLELTLSLISQLTVKRKLLLLKLSVRAM